LRGGHTRIVDRDLRIGDHTHMRRADTNILVCSAFCCCDINYMYRKLIRA